MEYSWKNNELWQIVTTEKNFEEFEQPYIGNGILGSRFEKLTVGVDNNPLYCISRAVYDNGKQLLLPAWNHIIFEVNNISYTSENGKHHLTQILDLRNAVVTMIDEWEYISGEMVKVEAEMFIPRTLDHSSYLNFSVSNLHDDAKLGFGLLGTGIKGYAKMDFSKSEDYTILGEYKTKVQDRQVAQAIKWNGSGLTNYNVDIKNDEIKILADTNSNNIKLEIFHAVSSYEESNDSKTDALNRVNKIYSMGRDKLYNINCDEWKKIWENGIAYRNKDFDIEKTMIAHQFHLLCSLEDTDYPLGPLGLSKNEWGGNQLWDADLWLFRAILPLWPKFAKSIIEFRKKTLEGAKNHARFTGYKGAWYGCITDDAGNNITPIRFNDEIHVNIWIALAAWEYFVFTKDKKHLRETGWPLISAIADFFVSRSNIECDGLYHINFVIGPDEAVCECGLFRVNDNFLINFGVKRLMEAALKAAVELGEKANENWSELHDKIFLVTPDAYGIIPEYQGYIGHGIKQADVILAFYPLGFSADKDIIFKNLKFYRDKQMYYGPLMSSQIESCIMMQYGEKDEGIKRLFSGMKEFSRGPHYIPFECRDYTNDNSIMLTGIGGEMQALIYGYYEATLENTDSIPKMKEYMD